jgi:hypothetical protein
MTSAQTLQSLRRLYESGRQKRGGLMPKTSLAVMSSTTIRAAEAGQCRGFDQLVNRVLKYKPIETRRIFLAHLSVSLGELILEHFPAEIKDRLDA